MNSMGRLVVAALVRADWRRRGSVRLVGRKVCPLRESVNMLGWSVIQTLDVVAFLGSEA